MEGDVAGGASVTRAGTMTTDGLGRGLGGEEARAGARGLAGEFEAERTRLTAVAQRLLGSRSDAEDAVQETWVRLQRSGEAGTADEITNLGGWLTTVTSRVCLDVLRARRARPELLSDVTHPGTAVEAGPEAYAEAADSVGTALLVVLDALGPAERLAFVLHDVFGVPFEQIAPLVDRSPAAARQLASRARRRVQASAPTPDGQAAQREVVDAFFAAARSGNFERLIAVLHPDVVLRADLGPTVARGLPGRVMGVDAVAARAAMFARDELRVLPALVNGSAGVVIMATDRPVSVMAFTVARGRVVAIDVLGDPERLRRLDLSALPGSGQPNDPGGGGCSSGDPRGALRSVATTSTPEVG